MALNSLIRSTLYLASPLLLFSLRTTLSILQEGFFSIMD